MSVDFNGVAATSAAVAIAIATVATSASSYMNQRATKKLAKHQADQASAAKTAAETVASTLATNTDATNAKLDTIHTLVNSNMTEVMQSKLDGLRRELVWMQGVTAPTAEAQDAITITEAEITELQTQLNERTKAAGP